MASKLLMIGCAFLVMALGSIGLTLWVSWQLEGGAAAVNEAGRLRMQTYRVALMQPQPALQQERAAVLQAMEASLERLRAGDPSRPLFVPWNDATRSRFDDVRARWQLLQPRWAEAGVTPALPEVDGFVERVDGFVGAIEQQLSDRTALLRSVQFVLVALAVVGTVVFLYTGHLIVLEPLRRLRGAVARIRSDDFSARVEVQADDEFAELATAFNGMASHLQALYRQLEAKVAEKTEHLEVKRQRLAALYEVSAFIGSADALSGLAEGFAAMVRRIAQADAVAVRWADADNARYLMLAADGLPTRLRDEEQCVTSGDCHCGQQAAQAHTRTIPIVPDTAVGSLMAEGHCGRIGYRTLLSVPVRLHDRLLGEIDIFFREARDLQPEERSLYETMASHLAARMHSLRANALEKESAVAQERTLLAQELHDSIAQSLAFLKIQVALLKEAMRQQDTAAMARGVGELETGVKESYADVRELLLHFRTRASHEDIMPALRQTLQKFEHQSGLRTQLQSSGHGVPLPADVQIQVLHVLQEALSNVRKHAGATQVRLSVQQAPAWRFEVQDDGRGFDPDAVHDETHVGLRIMRERAQRIGAEVRLASAPGAGTTLSLLLPPMAAAVPPTLPEPHEHRDADSLAGGR
ncbi:type IV pili methyl-accepting chemotaxis transducer N-terminal domain-containing protein [Aquabacterium sp.]|uniref:type IV pili methyl-accepting chemotaxis transducer N-terminal domain-containing protein n=1 Tax=Aquabacterium sp. TaxID=1872578 RepID=UPI003783ED03